MRQRQKVGDFTSKNLIKVMGSGALVPSFIISKLWMDELEKLKQIVDETFQVLDEKEKTARAAAAKLEADIVRRFVELRDRG